jgi:hypothetical protein
MSKHGRRVAPTSRRLTRSEVVVLVAAGVRGVAAGAGRALLDWLLS